MTKKKQLAVALIKFEEFYKGRMSLGLGPGK